MSAQRPFGFVSCIALASVVSCGAPASTSQPLAPTPSVSSPPAPPATAAPAINGGMWTLDNFPSELVERQHGFKPTAEWLRHVQLASVRLARGCSGSIVSGNGLILTNHHCAHGCIQAVSTKEKDYVASGFKATSEDKELQCPNAEINQLLEITDVTHRVSAAGAGLSDQARNEARKGEIARIEKACASSEQVRCDVVTLYHGGLYHLYKYKRYQDVRLVFAPEVRIAFFGGDPDNFMFPRYDLDASFLRVYENGKPASTAEHFKWSKQGAQGGQLTFVSGHPGSTSRMLTIAELEYLRDHALPSRLLRLAEARGMLTEFQRRGPEQKRISGHPLFGIENALKALKGRHSALLDSSLMQQKRRAENELQEAVKQRAADDGATAQAWPAIAAAQEELRKIRKPLGMIEHSGGFWSKTMSHARTLVRSAEERTKPSEKRFHEFSDAKLPELEQELFSKAPIYDDLEIATLTLSLTQLREELGPDDPFVRSVLGAKSPSELAELVIKGSKVDEVGVRESLYAGGKNAIEESGDPAIALARLIEPEARRLRELYEDRIEAVVKKNSELIAQARFQMFGTSVYPDATFTLRLSFGVVEGWQENGRKVPPMTTIGGAFERHTGRPPYDLPDSWLKGKERLNLQTPMNFATTNDIIGGNSGSPVIDKNGEIVGLIFDGNIHSLGGDYWFDEEMNRAVAVHSAAIVEALDKIYGAEGLLRELGVAAPD